MAKLCSLNIAFFLLLQLAFADYSPSLPPSLGANLPPHLAPTPDSPPAISPALGSSPPAPSPSDLEQGGSPPSPSSPAPSPEEASDINHSNVNADVGEENTGGGGGGGMSGGKKAGIVVAVVVAACLVVVGGLVYKKRQDNIRRSQYGYAARAELL
ncbi:Disulfide isomerase L-2 isoform 1 [Hibiscus syriacus]|uniref:Disulfide isomerase L-2 isoform 1 n=1 Tax=Hibiscus syriacus TaxID=106335 RepID=A0A6A3CWV6_HIBSY|nr:classical arabinogalactan protein 7-like [Hibiscus syriacus]KAE8732987.1 Disulfide isomerase L-2 isoform 1 [Hibiscus syriacus]